jgi:hypothetical protein
MRHVGYQNLDDWNVPRLRGTCVCHVPIEDILPHIGDEKYFTCPTCVNLIKLHITGDPSVANSDEAHDSVFGNDIHKQRLEELREDPEMEVTTYSDGGKLRFYWAHHRSLRFSREEDRSLDGSERNRFYRDSSSSSS